MKIIGASGFEALFQFRMITFDPQEFDKLFWLFAVFGNDFRVLCAKLDGFFGDRRDYFDVAGKGAFYVFSLGITGQERFEALLHVPHQIVSGRSDQREVHLPVDHEQRS